MGLPLFRSGDASSEVIRLKYVGGMDADMVKQQSSVYSVMPHTVSIDIGAIDLEWHQAGVMSALGAYTRLNDHVHELAEALVMDSEPAPDLSQPPSAQKPDHRPSKADVQSQSEAPRTSVFFELKLTAKQVRATMFLPGTGGASESALLQFTLGNADLRLEYTAAHHYHVRTTLDELLVLDQAEQTTCMYPTILGPWEEGQTVFIELELTAARTMRSRVQLKVTPFKAVYCHEFVKQITQYVSEAQTVNEPLQPATGDTSPSAAAEFIVPTRRLFILKGTDGFGMLLNNDDAAVLVVNSDSPAAAAGVRKDDIIVEVDGTKVSNKDETIAVLGRSNADFAEFGFLDGWQYSTDVISFEMQMPNLKYVADRKSRAATILSSTRILVRQDGEHISVVTMEDSKELSLSLQYLADFGGCTAPVLDAKLTLASLNIRLPVPRRDGDPVTKVDASLNIDAKVWEPTGGSWQRFAFLGTPTGVVPAIKLQYDCSADGVSTVQVKTDASVPTLGFSAGVIEWLAHAGRADHMQSTVENLCGVTLQVFCPDNSAKWLHANETATFTTKSSTEAYGRDAASVAAMPELNIMVEDCEPSIRVPIFQYADSEHVLTRTIYGDTESMEDQQYEEVRVVCVVEIVGAAVRVQVRSTLEIVNKTKYDLEILAVSGGMMGHSAGVVEGYGKLCVPTPLAGASECRVRHAAFRGIDDTMVTGSPLLVADGLASHQLMTVSLPGGIDLHFRAISSWTTHRKVTIEPAFYATNLLAEDVRIGHIH